MDLTIILDKSTFQLLSYDEIVRLRSYYKHNITPVLTMEVLGDLKKEAKEGSAPPRNRVIDFATKLFPHDSVVNAHYLKMAKSDLVTAPIDADGRPFLDIQKGVETSDGQRGWVIKETTEEKAIGRWRDGSFMEAEFDLSQLWRDATTQQDILENLKKSLSVEMSEGRLTSLEMLGQHVDGIISDQSRQDAMLRYLAVQLRLAPFEMISVQTRWNQAGRPLLKVFAPYACYYLKVNLLFDLALKHNLIGTKPTNLVDLQYLYYLPFCNVFSSNDKVHSALAPLLISEDQKFIKGEELKQDLKRINLHLNELNEEERKKFFARPPVLDDSPTFQFWKFYFDYPNKNFETPFNGKGDPSLIAKFKEFERASRDGQELDSIGDPDFIVRKTMLGKNDPCLCGSGKRVIDCHITEAEFDEIVKKSVKNSVEGKVEVMNSFFKGTDHQTSNDVPV